MKRTDKLRALPHVLREVTALSASEVVNACTVAGSPFFSPATMRFFDTVTASTAWRGGGKAYLALDNRAAPAGCRFTIAEVDLYAPNHVGSNIVRTYLRGREVYYADTVEAARETAKTLAYAAAEVPR